MIALFDIESILSNGGLLILAAIVFAESGLFFGFFLPGDSLLFIAGFLASDAGNHQLDFPLPIVALVTIASAIAGDQVGYIFGNKVGPALFSRPKSRFFNPDHVQKASHFFEKYGARTIVLARFVPIVRTFAPIVAGAGSMHYRTFVKFNIIGGVLWGGGLTTLGFYLGEIEVVKNNIEIAVIAIVGLSVLPVALELIKHRRASRAHS